MARQLRVWVTAAVVLCALVGLAACGADDDPSITVFAAASLTDAFTELAEAYEDESGVGVELSFAGSASLREQIVAGAPADVFASANVAVMDDAVDAGVVDDPVLFARNTPQIAVPRGNPAGVEDLEDLAADDLLIGLCAAGVPCGDLARDVLDAAGVVAAPDTEESDVRALLTKLGAGELDAGLVYVTDVRSSDDVEGIDLPDDLAALGNDYPIAVVSGTERAEGAADFVDFVGRGAGRRILADQGFLEP